ncbi:MAG: inosose dehydratase [Pseudonocardiales bacterium]|nr:MAG: inosose dehydratase [Pseudonocardiales bacterium]
MRIAGAPISWGICEVPGWGYQLDPTRVLAEMRAAGLAATEFGPDGFLPGDPAARAATLRAAGLEAVGGFVPVVLHDPSADPTPRIDRTLDSFVAAGATMLVLAAATGLGGYDARLELDDAGWKTLCANLDRIAEQATERGVRATLHPHVGTMVEHRDDVDRALEGCSIPLCLDTGHLLIGGTDPVQLARGAANRIAHVHLKDVDDAIASRMRNAEITYTAAVSAGMYKPLGQGDIDIASVVGSLTNAGYDGWWVLEQDTMLRGEPAGEGPVAGVRASVAFLQGLAP